MADTPVDCPQHCDAVHAREGAKLKALYKAEKQSINDVYDQPQRWLEGDLRWAEQSTADAYARVLSPNESAAAACRAKFNELTRLQRKIGQAIEQMSVPGTDYDHQRRAIEDLQAKYNQAEPDWRTCRDKLVANTPGLGERQQQYLGSAKYRALAAERKRDLEAQRAEAVTRAATAHEADLEWLDRMLEACQKKNEWPARIGEGVSQTCACRLENAMAAVSSAIVISKEKERKYLKTTRDLDQHWDELNTFLKARTEEMTPEVAAWIEDGIGLAVDANLTLYDMAAALHLDPEDLRNAGRAARDLNKDNHWSLLDAAINSYYDETQALVTATGKALKKSSTVVKDSAQGWAEKFLGAATKNKGFMVSGIKGVQGVLADGPARVQQNLIAITDLQHQAAQQLADAVAAREAEENNWDALLTVPCLVGSCPSWMAKQEYEALKQGLHGATDSGARSDFTARAFSDRGPFNSGLLATGRYCDQCAGLSALTKLRAHRDYSRSVVGRIEHQIVHYQLAYADTIDQLIRYLQNSTGFTETLFGRYHIAYTVSTIGLSFWFPWSVFALSATETAVNNWSNITQTVPTAKQSADTLRELARQLDDKRTDMVYWRGYTRSLDEQLNRLLSRVHQCALKSCTSTTDVKAVLASIPACPSSVTDELTGCWAFSVPNKGSMLISREGKKVLADVQIDRTNMWGHYGGMLQSLLGQSASLKDSPKNVIRFEGIFNDPDLVLHHKFDEQSLRTRFPGLTDTSVRSLLGLDPSETKRLRFSRTTYHDRIQSPGGYEMSTLDGRVRGTSISDVHGAAARGSIEISPGTRIGPRPENDNATWFNTLVKVDVLSPHVMVLGVHDTPDPDDWDSIEFQHDDRVWFSARSTYQCSQRQEELIASVAPSGGEGGFGVSLKETGSDTGVFLSSPIDLSIIAIPDDQREVGLMITLPGQEGLMESPVSGYFTLSR